jgi:hypothetical protein
MNGSIYFPSTQSIGGIRMTKLKNIAGACLLLALVLTSCTGQAAPVQPTPDLGAIRDEVVATVVAKITADAALNPTPTQAPTNTTAPTQSMVTATAAVPVLVTGGTVTPIATKKVVSGGGGVFIPSKTPYTDSALLISQSPKDGSSFAPGADFDIVWTIKNTGLRTWTSDFYIRYLKGTEGSKSKTYSVTPIAVNDTTDVRVDMVAPSTPGTYNSVWQLVNDDAVVIYTLNLVFFVK